LQVARGGSKSWILRYKVNGRSRHLGLGPLHSVSLAQARQRAAEARRLLLDGRDPIEAKRSARIAARLADARSMNFDQCVDKYIASHSAAWRSAKHTAQSPHGARYHHGAWIPQRVSSVVRGANEFPGRDCRGCAGARRGPQGDRGIPAHGFLRATTRAHECMGRLLQPASRSGGQCGAVARVIPG
jgi:hypothetical protein